jgi:type III restriction enzyme
MHTLWVPGVNNLGAYGTWAFAEFRDVYAIQQDFSQLLDRFLTKELADGAQSEAQAGRRAAPQRKAPQHFATVIYH